MRNHVNLCVSRYDAEASMRFAILGGRIKYKEAFPSKVVTIKQPVHEMGENILTTMLLFTFVICEGNIFHQPHKTSTSG